MPENIDDRFGQKVFYSMLKSLWGAAVCCEGGQDDAKTRQEIAILNMLLPAICPCRPREVLKTESPDFEVTFEQHPTRIFVEIVTAVAEVRDVDDDGATGETVNYEQRATYIRKGKRLNYRYTTDATRHGEIVRRCIKEKADLARTWRCKRPIVLLVGLVGTSSPISDIQDAHIEPFVRVVVGPSPTIILPRGSEPLHYAALL